MRVNLMSSLLINYIKLDEKPTSDSSIVNKKYNLETNQVVLVRF